MSLFQKILDEKLKRQDKQSTMNDSPSESTVSPELLRWINSTPFSQSFSFTVENTGYSSYQKSREEILERQLKKDRQNFEAFLSTLSDHLDVQSAEFFFKKGARKFVSGSVSDLKKDYRRLVFQLHPDRNSGVTLTKQREVYEDFYSLSEAYERLLVLFSRANKG